jgi:hypothetical protein
MLLIAHDDMGKELQMPPFKYMIFSRDIILIAILIGSICFVTLTPAMYLVFHALQWKAALRVVEFAFPPALLIAIAACLLAYQRARLRRESWHDEASSEKRV